jgi:hypothetical protein
MRVTRHRAALCGHATKSQPHPIVCPLLVVDATSCASDACSSTEAGATSGSTQRRGAPGSASPRELVGHDNHWKISVVQSPPWRRTSWARAGPSGRAWKSTKKSRSTSIPPCGWQFTFSTPVPTCRQATTRAPPAAPAEPPAASYRKRQGSARLGGSRGPPLLSSELRQSLNLRCPGRPAHGSAYG